MVTGHVIAVAVSLAVVGQTSNVQYDKTITEGLSYPARVAFSPEGGIYVTDPPAKAVVAYDDAGNFLATYAIPEVPVGIAVHSDGRVFLSRQDGKIGVYSATFSSLGVVAPAPRTLSNPNDLAFDPGTGELYCVDSGAGQVLVFSESAPGTWTLARFWGIEGSGLGQMVSPQALALDAELHRVLITDTDNFRVQVFDTTGILLFKFGYRILYTLESETAWFSRTEGLAVDGCSNIYITDALMGTVRVFGSGGNELTDDHEPLIAYGTGAGQLRSPAGLAIDDAGKLYVANTSNNSIEVFDVSCTPAVASAEAPPTAGATRDEKRDNRAGAARVIDAAFFPKRQPDSPLDVVEAINAEAYRAEYDLNADGRLDLADVEIAVAQFDMGTLEDFVHMAGMSNVADHPTFQPPHILDLPDRCGRCHNMDGAPGGMLTAAGQENLCLSCHSSGKIAGKMWVGAGTDQNSHPWGVLADFGVSEGLRPGSELATHLDAGNIRCGTCHEPHGASPTVGYLRGPEMFKIENVPSPPSPPPPAAPWKITVMDPTLCGECHSEIVEQWKVAGHADPHADPFVHYDWTASNRASCRKCHSGYGYIDFDRGVPESQRRGNLRPVDCLVCHSTHGESQNASLLRAFDEVTLPGNVNLSGVGSAATCMTCHNGRNAVSDPGFTPHYLLGGAMLAGVNGITTFRGTTYTVVSSQHTQLMLEGDLTCATCHMAASPPPGSPGAGKVGGHTFNVRVHDPGAADDGFENVENACASCHTGLTTFNRTAGGDYDGDGLVEGVQDETQGLLDLVKSAIVAKGVISLPSYPYWITAQCQGGTNPGATCTSNSNCQGGGTCVSITNPPSDRAVVEDAIWNWEFVDNSSDLGVKNTGYAIGLLQVAYKGVTGQAVPNAAYRYSPAP